MSRERTEWDTHIHAGRDPQLNGGGGGEAAGGHLTAGVSVGRCLIEKLCTDLYLVLILLLFFGWAVSFSCLAELALMQIAQRVLGRRLEELQEQQRQEQGQLLRLAIEINCQSVVCNGGKLEREES